MANNISKHVVTLDDGTKILQTYRMDNVNGQKRILPGPAFTSAQLQAQIDSLTADLASLAE